MSKLTCHGSQGEEDGEEQDIDEEDEEGSAVVVRTHGNASR